MDLQKQAVEENMKNTEYIKQIGINVEQMFSSRYLFSIFLMLPLEKSHYHISKYLLIKSLNVVLSCVIKLSIIALQLEQKDRTQIRKARRKQEFTGILTELFLPLIQAKVSSPSSMLHRYHLLGAI